HRDARLLDAVEQRPDPVVIEGDVVDAVEEAPVHRGSLAARRKTTDDLEPAPARATRLDRSSRGRDDVLHDREAESRAPCRACRVCTVEALEEPAQIGCVDTDAVVGDR